MTFWRSVNVPYENGFSKIDIIDQNGSVLTKPLLIKVSAICVSHLDSKGVYKDYSSLLLCSKLVNKTSTKDGAFKNVYSPLAYITLNTHMTESRIFSVPNPETFVINSGKAINFFLCDFEVDHLLIIVAAAKIFTESSKDLSINDKQMIKPFF